MSIWAHINDIESQRLREARRAVLAAEAALAKIDKVKQERAEELHSLAGLQLEYQVHVVARAVGESYAELPPMPPTEAKLRTHIAGLEQHRHDEQQNLECCVHQFKTLSNDVLRVCVGRAAGEYQAHAAGLAQSWQQITAAKFVLGESERGWEQVFIPALAGMPGAMMDFNRPTLFAATRPNVESLEAELARLVL